MIISRTPLRMSFAGGGSDLRDFYKHGYGAVLSTAINKYVYIYVNRPAADDLLRIKYSRYEEVTNVGDIQHDLVRPALSVLNLNSSLEIVSMADVPTGTGLGSSGSYLVALLTALYAFKRDRVPVQALAEQACYIEIELAGHPVGKHDQYLAAFGGITCLDIKPDGKVHVSPLDISVSAVDELRNCILLFYTGITRLSRDILEDQDQDTQSGDTTVVDSLHRTKDLGYRIKEALEQADLERFGLLLNEHWQNKKCRSGKISNPNIDRWYDIAKANGALGGKIIGAGGGGFLMLYCPNSAKPKVRQALAAEGLREMPFGFDFEGAKVLVNL